MGYLVLIIGGIALLALFTGFGLGDGFKARGKARKKDVRRAESALTDIQRLVLFNRNQLDLVGQVLADDISNIILSYYGVRETDK